MAKNPKSVRQHGKASKAWDKAADSETQAGFEAADAKLKAKLAHTNRDYLRGVHRAMRKSR